MILYSELWRARMAYEQNRFRVVLNSIKYIVETIFICRGASNRTKEIYCPLKQIIQAI